MIIINISRTAMPHTLDLSIWPRRAHYEFYRKFESPFFNLTAEVDVSALAEICRGPNGPSFFAATMHSALVAINEIEAFKYRIRGDEVVVHEVIHGGTTVMMPNETFVFGYFDFDPDFAAFAANVEAEMKRLEGTEGTLEARPEHDAVIHSSVIPWVRFTSFAHAKGFGASDSIPKLVWGQRTETPEGWRMPVSVEVHHALVDGLHVGRFFERYQELLDAAETWLSGDGRAR